ncbi:unnamed protein product [Thelazia callipaeda]|uniref:Post-GPI attachment to proteins factor 3 n=1 Tax=Thelazia callipaeda TaxID=103827 RepID=A0A0N5CKP4_THECL|nr:unnamed protein product [Thelazia callipaeda]
MKLPRAGLFTLILLTRFTDGSVGDGHQVYLKCVGTCIVRYDCPREPDAFGWIFGECFRCRHTCIWRTANYFTDVLHLSIPQFYGKWPFTAIWLPIIVPVPIHEFGSVVFSILNLLTTYSLYRTVRRLHRLARLKLVWTAYSIIGIMMWSCSTVFHWADFWLTEYLDYFTACAFIVFALFTSISFTIKKLQNSFKGKIIWLLLFVILFYLYAAHIYSLTVFFDYGYNMKVCIACSLLTASIYYMWLFQQWLQRDHSNRQSLLYLGMLLDFMPIFGLFDAHSLFHLATVPLPLLMARFIVLESAYEMRRQLGSIKLA